MFPIQQPQGRKCLNRNFQIYFCFVFRVCIAYFRTERSCLSIREGIQGTILIMRYNFKVCICKKCHDGIYWCSTILLY